MNEGGLTALLSEHAMRHSVPGAAIGVLHDGVGATACHGVADIASGDPLTDESLFSVGSLTKSMVATAIARLEQTGRLSLDDPIVTHVPELRASDWAHQASLRDLLANRSGLPLRAALEFDFDGRLEDDDDALRRLTAEAAASGPASDFWSYTNVGWCLLGRAIETATGSVWEDAMHTFLAGAGMRSTAFATRPGTDRRVSGHELTADGPVPVPPLVARAYGPAGSTTVSTVTDLLRFAEMHLDDPALAALRTVHAEVPIHGWLDSWCLGWARFEWDGGPVWGWDGLVAGERSALRIMPEQHAAVVVMTNCGNGRAMHRSLFADLMRSRFDVHVPPLRLDPAPNAAGDLARFAGVYAWPDERVAVTAVGDSLLIARAEGTAEAFAVDERVFVVDVADPDNPTVTFGAFDDDGRPRVLYDMLWGLPRLDA